MTTIIICLTVIFCVIWITLWIKHMVINGLPLFTYGRCMQCEENNLETKPNPVGFQPDADDGAEVKEKTTKEQKESYLKDPITLTASLLRGEVDIDDITG